MFNAAASSISKLAAADFYLFPGLKSAFFDGIDIFKNAT